MIVRRIAGAAAIAGALLAGSSTGDAAPTGPDAMRSLQFLVGTWNCAHTVGDFSGTYTERFANGLGHGTWIEQTYEFPATATEPAVQAHYYLEYDARVPRWVRFGAHDNGQYYGMYSTTAGGSSWVWNYVLPSSRGSATWTKVSETEYRIDGPSYSENGQDVTEHHDCKKL